MEIIRYQGPQGPAVGLLDGDRVTPLVGVSDVQALMAGWHPGDARRPVAGASLAPQGLRVLAPI